MQCNEWEERIRLKKDLLHAIRNKKKISNFSLLVHTCEVSKIQNHLFHFAFKEIDDIVGHHDDDPIGTIQNSMHSKSHALLRSKY